MLNCEISKNCVEFLSIFSTATVIYFENVVFPKYITWISHDLVWHIRKNSPPEVLYPKNVASGQGQTTFLPHFCMGCRIFKVKAMPIKLHYIEKSSIRLHNHPCLCIYLALFDGNRILKGLHCVNRYYFHVRAVCLMSN